MSQWLSVGRVTVVQCLVEGVSCNRVVAHCLEAERIERAIAEHESAVAVKDSRSYLLCILER